MNYVQPIRQRKQIDNMKQRLIERNERDYILFVTGINVGLRIADLLLFRVETVKGAYVDVIEGKTGKRKIIKINRALREALDPYIAGKPDSEFLFKSRNMKHISALKDQPIDCSMAYKALRQTAIACGIPDFGTHSLRKTFGYHSYLKNKDVALLMDLFNHSHPSITLRYVGITQDTLDEAVDDLNL